MELAEIISHNIKTLRNKQGLSQQTLAARSGLPRSTISTMETGASSPGIASLLAVSKALSVRLDEMVTAPSPGTSLTKAWEVQKISRSGGKVVLYKLLPEPVRGMEIDRIVVAPGARLRGVPHISGTREYLNCLKGKVTLFCEGDRHDLETGDVLAFPGDVSHSYYNPGTTPAECFSVVSLSEK